MAETNGGQDGQLADVHFLQYRVRPPEAAPTYEEYAVVIPMRSVPSTPEVPRNALEAGPAEPLAIEAGEEQDGDFDNAG